MRRRPDCPIDRLWEGFLAAAHEGAPVPVLPEDGLEPAERGLLELYLELLEPHPDGPRVIAHLGQSLDGRIATACGHSSFVTCQSNIVHMHRLRALVDAVLVGSATIARDDPQLTVRHVQGPSPLRVVLDPSRRLPPGRRVFREIPPHTLVYCRREQMQGGHRPGRAELAGIEPLRDRLPPAAILADLAARGVRRVLVEGGGVTVSRFLEAGCLDAIQLCIAPVIIGSGRESLRLAPIRTMQEALRLEPRVLPMGQDWLFACRLERQGASGGQEQHVQMADGEREAPPGHGRQPLGPP